MSRIKTLQSLFKRYRRPGDIVFAWFFFAISVFLLSQIADQTAYRDGSNVITQPRFWPAVSLIGMCVFAALHLIGSILSERIEGRWSEVLLWVRVLEFGAWFIAYAYVVPIIGYLPATIFVALLLVARVGYRNRQMFISAAALAVAIVLLFKTFLQVKMPAGQVYEVLPDGLRQIMLTYF